MLGDFLTAATPYCAAVATLAALYALFVRSVAKQNLINANAVQEKSIVAQNATISALEPRIEALEASNHELKADNTDLKRDITALKAAAKTDKNTISGLKGERTKLMRRVRGLEEYITLLHGVLRQAGITAPPLPPADGDISAIVLP